MAMWRTVELGLAVKFGTTVALMNLRMAGDTTLKEPDGQSQASTKSR
jgi:hypothetical protein